MFGSIVTALRVLWGGNGTKYISDPTSPTLGCYQRLEVIFVILSVMGVIHNITMFHNITSGITGL